MPKWYEKKKRKDREVEKTYQKLLKEFRDTDIHDVIKGESKYFKDIIRDYTLDTAEKAAMAYYKLLENPMYQKKLVGVPKKSKIIGDTALCLGLASAAGIATHEIADYAARVADEIPRKIVKKIVKKVPGGEKAYNLGEKGWAKYWQGVGKRVGMKKTREGVKVNPKAPERYVTSGPFGDVLGLLAGAVVLYELGKHTSIIPNYLKFFKRKRAIREFLGKEYGREGFKKKVEEDLEKIKNERMKKKEKKEDDQK